MLRDDLNQHIAVVRDVGKGDRGDRVDDPDQTAASETRN
jgi:hypothetical protein